MKLSMRFMSRFASQMRSQILAMLSTEGVEEAMTVKMGMIKRN